MKEIYYMTFHEVNSEGKKKLKPVTCDDLTQVSRSILTHKPSRGYEVIHITIGKELILL